MDQLRIVVGADAEDGLVVAQAGELEERRGAPDGRHPRLHLVE